VNRSDRDPKELAPYNVSVLSLEANYELPFGATLTSISAYWNSTDLVYQDFDGGFSNPADATQNDPNSVFSRLHTRREQYYDVFSQELRLVGSLFDDSVSYVGGFYYAHDDHDHTQRTEQQLQVDFAGVYALFGIPLGTPCNLVVGPAGFPFDGPSQPGRQWCAGTGAAGNPAAEAFSSQETHLTNDSWALFGSVEWELPWIEGLRVNGGLRYINETKEFRTRFDAIANNTLVDSVLGANILTLSKTEDSWDDIVGEAGVNYQAMENLLVYYRFAQGYRSGGFSLRGSQPSPTVSDPRSWSLTFDPEDTNSHEIGVKTTWLDGRLTANFASFLNQVDGSQGSSIISGITPVGTNTLVLNGGRTEIYGVEVESSLELFEGLLVDFTLGWQHGELKNSVQSSHNLAAPAPASNTLCNLVSGLPLAAQNESSCPTVSFHNNAVGRTPELTWSVGASYRIGVGPGEIVLGSRVRHNDFFWISPPSIPDGATAATNTPVGQSGYTLVDANLGYEFKFGAGERSARVGFVGRNLSDERYKEQALPLGEFGFQGWGPPRYVGGEFSLEL
jgi:outer membrane receptor protein involved in Fe transport